MYSSKTLNIASKIFGAFFILAFISYRLGSGIMETVAGISVDLESIYNQSAVLVFGVISMALIHTFVNVGLPVIMTPVLKHTNKMLTYGYLSAGISATVTLIIGAVMMIMLVPLSESYVSGGARDAQYFETLALVLKKGNL